MPLSLGTDVGECSSLEDCLGLFTQPEALTGDSSLPALDPTAPPAVIYLASHRVTAVCNAVRIADEAASGNEARCRLGCLGAPHAAAYTRLRDDCAHLYCMPVSRANHGSSGPRHQKSQKTGALRTVESCAGLSRYQSPNGLVDATKTLSIGPAKFLFLQLKRYNNRLRVRRDVISLPARLDLRPFCHRDGSHALGSTDSADEREYALIGVIMHRCTGISLQSGHCFFGLEWRILRPCRRTMQA